MPGFESTTTLTLAEFAVLCPLTVEWEAVLCRLSLVQDPADPSDLTLPSVFGKIGEHTVVCVRSGKGEANCSAALQFVLAKWRPRWVILTGIAGGFPERGLNRGDLIVANFVYNLDFGKLVDGRFLRRPEYDFQPDLGLLGHAEVLAESHKHSWVQGIRAVRPDGRPPTATVARVGYVASGNKVIDDPEVDVFAATRLSIPEIDAVEMEGSGAGAAIRLEQTQRAVGFLMIRGVSDEPAPMSSSSQTGSEQRTAWRRYAADVAGAFLEEFLRKRPPLVEPQEGQEPAAAEHSDLDTAAGSSNSDALEALLASLEIRFSPLAQSCLANLSASPEHVLELLKDELAGHKLLLSLDYASHPRALRADYYVVLTKRDSILTIDSVNRAMPKSEVYEAWQRVSTAYYKAYALEFRINHLVLARESEFKRSFHTLQLTLVALSAFIESTRVFEDSDRFKRLHVLKNDAIETLEGSELLYYDYLNGPPSDDELLGRVAIGMDSVVSCVHKILLDYSLPR